MGHQSCPLILNTMAHFKSLIEFGKHPFVFHGRLTDCMIKHSLITLFFYSATNSNWCLKRCNMKPHRNYRLKCLGMSLHLGQTRPTLSHGGSPFTDKQYHLREGEEGFAELGLKPSKLTELPRCIVNLLSE